MVFKETNTVADSAWMVPLNATKGLVNKQPIYPSQISKKQN